MIVEAPRARLHRRRDTHSACADGGCPARGACLSSRRITGVAFFDYDHGQTGVAPSAIELHPILTLRCLSG
jgi:hypothetical protein